MAATSASPNRPAVPHRSCTSMDVVKQRHFTGMHHVAVVVEEAHGVDPRFPSDRAKETEPWRNAGHCYRAGTATRSFLQLPVDSAVREHPHRDPLACARNTSKTSHKKRLTMSPQPCANDGQKLAENVGDCAPGVTSRSDSIDERPSLFTPLLPLRSQNLI